MIYNFDEIIDRSNTYSAKNDEMVTKFGIDDLIPLWIANIGLEVEQPIISDEMYSDIMLWGNKHVPMVKRALVI